MRRLLLPLALIASIFAVPSVSSALPKETQGASTATYVAQFKAGADVASQAAVARNLGFTIDTQYTAAINGFAAKMTAAQAAALQKNPSVLSVESDLVMNATATQSSATWGLDRIDQRDLPLNSTFNYPDNAGSGVTVYVFDTGINSSHVDFTGRILGGYTAINDGRGTSDCNGHGTHVSGTIAGTRWGVAKSASLVPVRVLNCQGSGTLTGLLDAITWVMTNHTTGKAVANMSLGFGSVVDSVTTAVTNLTADGVLLAAAAGNDGVDACTSSPGNTPSAVTVGATSSSDARTSWSNYGTCVDLFAPGLSITSAWYTSTTATNTISGTSMASPHVAGIAAAMLSASTTYTADAAGVAALTKSVLDATTPNKVVGAGTGSPNKLAYLASTTVTPAPTVTAPPAPTVNATSSKSRASVSWSYTSTGGAALSGQTLQVRLISNGTESVQSTTQIGASVTSATISNLVVGQNYTFCVSGTNSAGTGAWGCSATATIRR